MPRYAMKLEYDGAPFAGWQRQSGQASVQGALEAAIHAFSGERIRIAAAGRGAVLQKMELIVRLRDRRVVAACVRSDRWRTRCACSRL